jgi:hypothetical protein
MANKAEEAQAVRSTLDDFSFAERIGSGSFGVVWRAVRKQDGADYAIKEIDLQGLSKKVGRRCPVPLGACMPRSGSPDPRPARGLPAGPGR